MSVEEQGQILNLHSNNTDIKELGCEKMRLKTKSLVTAIVLCSMLSLILASIAYAAGSIALTPTTQAAGGSVSVAGTSFASAKAVGIGVGAEVAGSDSNMNYSMVAGSSGLNWTGRLSHYPIKPGSFVLSSETVGGLASTYTDLGDGTCSWSYDGSIMGKINYVTGVWYRGTTVDVTTYTAIYSATYTYFQYNATPAAGVTTSATGTFTASVTVPMTIGNGNFNVTAVDTSGNRAVASLTISGVIPEILPVGLMILLAAVAVFAGSKYSSRLMKGRNSQL